jgi:hypothetical protein
MTIKPKRKKSGRDFGTRRQWRRVWRDRAWPLWMLDVETSNFKFGIDVGSKDATAIAVFRDGKLLVLDRIMPDPVFRPNEWQLGKEALWELLRERLAAGQIRTPTDEELIEELRAPRIDPYSDLALAMGYAFEVDKPRKLGKSPALAAPYGSPKDSG